MRKAAVGLVIALLAAGCPRPVRTPNGTPSGAECTAGSTLTYDTFGRAFVEAYCTRCHASHLSGAARERAPVGVDFDTIEGIRAHADRMDSQAAGGPARTNAFMPPADPFPSTAERALLGEWLACGAP